MFPTVRMVRLGMTGSKEPVNRFRLSETTSSRMPLLIQQDRNSWWAVCGSSSQEGKEAQSTWLSRANTSRDSETISPYNRV